MTNQERTNKFPFGNNGFQMPNFQEGIDFIFPGEMTKEEFEEMFNKRLRAFHRHHDFDEDFFTKDSRRKENLKPLSTRVKPHTKDFYRNDSILSPREVLELYEEFNNGSEAFINSLLEEEKELENELVEVQEKLHNAKLFKEKLGELKPENDVLTDQDKILKLKQKYKLSEIKDAGNEISAEKIKKDIIRDIQIYNTVIIRIFDNQVLSIGVFTDDEPVVYYFKNEYSKEDIEDIFTSVEEFCGENEIEFESSDDSVFAD